MSYGFASNLRDALPNASFIGFTGTPIEKTDANTRQFLAEVRGLKHKNFAAELLEKLLRDELRVRAKRNLVLAGSSARNSSKR